MDLNGRQCNDSTPTQPPSFQWFAHLWWVFTQTRDLPYHKRANHWKQGGWVGVESLHWLHSTVCALVPNATILHPPNRPDTYRTKCELTDLKNLPS
jgi:hypothetical protein